MSREALVLVAYDAPSGKVRERLAKICADAGLVRVQLSLFCGRIPRRRRRDMAAALKASADADESGVIVVPLDEATLKELVAVHRPSPVTELTPMEEAIRVKVADDFVW